jgi:hypothetical protein
MPFEPPCFAPEFFFDAGLLSVVRGAMDDRVVADQWGCDARLQGSKASGLSCRLPTPSVAGSSQFVFADLHAGCEFLA